MTDILPADHPARTMWCEVEEYPPLPGRWLYRHPVYGGYSYLTLMRPPTSALFSPGSQWTATTLATEVAPSPAPKHAPKPEPLAWQPMATCPRRLAGTLAEDVWIFSAHDQRPLRFLIGGRLRPGNDEQFTRLGWLPGNLPEADLPEAPK